MCRSLNMLEDKYFQGFKDSEAIPEHKSIPKLKWLFKQIAVLAVRSVVPAVHTVQFLLCIQCSTCCAYSAVPAVHTVQYLLCTQCSTCCAYSAVPAVHTVQYLLCIQCSTCCAHNTVHTVLYLLCACTCQSLC